MAPSQSINRSRRVPYLSSPIDLRNGVSAKSGLYSMAVQGPAVSTLRDPRASGPTHSGPTQWTYQSAQHPLQSLSPDQRIGAKPHLPQGTSAARSLCARSHRRTSGPFGGCPLTSRGALVREPQTPRRNTTALQRLVQIPRFN
jgi:hypothetical protein